MSRSPRSTWNWICREAGPVGDGGRDAKLSSIDRLGFSGYAGRWSSRRTGLRVLIFNAAHDVVARPVIVPSAPAISYSLQENNPLRVEGQVLISRVSSALG